MLMKFYQWLLTPARSEYEEYILSKDPKTVEDVEYWSRKYSMNTGWYNYLRNGGVA